MTKYLLDIIEPCVHEYRDYTLFNWNCFNSDDVAVHRDEMWEQMAASYEYEVI